MFHEYRLEDSLRLGHKCLPQCSWMAATCVKHIFGHNGVMAYFSPNSE
jgi:hypothetical protein